MPKLTPVTEEQARVLDAFAMVLGDHEVNVTPREIVERIHDASRRLMDCDHWFVVGNVVPDSARQSLLNLAAVAALGVQVIDRHNAAIRQSGGQP